MSEAQKGFEVPFERLSEDTLNALIDDFVLREGTDYGLNEYSLEQKRSHVFKQLKTKKVVVVFDPNSETTSILSQDQFHRFLHN